MSSTSKKPTDTTAAVRQQRRRKKIKEQQGRSVRVVLTKDQGDHLDALLDSGYARDQSSVMAKALDETYDRNIPPRTEQD